MTAKKAVSTLKNNVVVGWRSTIGGLLMVGLCTAYYIYYEQNLYYCAGGGLMGIGLIVAPDQIIPIFVGAIKAIFDLIISKFKK